MANDCCTCCSTGTVLILACSGGSNVGQLANAAAVRLSKEGKGKMSCLAGVGGHIDGIVESCKGADRVVVIDGCPIACGRKVCEHAGVPISTYVEVTGLGINKSYDLDLNEEDIKRVVDACGL